MLLNEAEVYGIPQWSTPYEPRDNELGVTFELLLYGDSGIYSPIGHAFYAKLEFAATRNRAAKKIVSMIRGWMVRHQMLQYRAAVKFQRFYRKWRRTAARRAQRRALAPPPEGGSLYDRLTNNAAVASMKTVQSFESGSRILGRGKPGHASSGFLSALVAAGNMADRQDTLLKKAEANRGAMVGSAQGGSQGTVGAYTNATVSRITAAKESAAAKAADARTDAEYNAAMAMTDEDEEIIAAATRIQAKMCVHGQPLSASAPQRLSISASQHLSASLPPPSASANTSRARCLLSGQPRQECSQPRLLSRGGVGGSHRQVPNTFGRAGRLVRRQGLSRPKRLLTAAAQGV